MPNDRPMKLISVNVSKPREVATREGTVRTGIFKEPVAGRVRVRRLNLDGDGQADLRVHGGEDKAIYAYPVEHYGYWEGKLKRREFPFGQFGENLTVEGMTEDEVQVGDVYRVGTALLQVSQPRSPCFKLALRMGVRDFPRTFLASGRVGFYLRVLEEGEVGAGDSLLLVRRDGVEMSVREISNLLYFDPANVQGMRKAMRLAALSPGWKEEFAQRLVAAGIDPA